MSKFTMDKNKEADLTDTYTNSRGVNSGSTVPVIPRENLTLLPAGGSKELHTH